MSTIDTANIDVTKPIAATPTTQSVRDNFSAIKTQLDNVGSVIDVKPQVHATIASLQAITTTPDSAYAITKGYTSNDDGGQGDWYWDSTSTETDNSGTIIKATAITTGRWKRLYSGSVYAAWFGVIADGGAIYSGGWTYTAGTDQGALINSLLSDGITDLILPPGNVYITTDIIPVGGMSLRGAHQQFSSSIGETPLTQLLYNGSGSCISADQAGVEVSYMSVSELKITDAREGISGQIPTQGYGLHTGYSVNGIYLRNLFITQFPDGPIKVGADSNAKAGDNIIIDNIWISPGRYILDYDAETDGFAVGEVITGGTSGHTATIAALDDNGATGRLVLTSPDGKFTDGEVITGAGTGSADVDGILKANGITIGSINNTCNISNIYCDGAGSAVTRSNGNNITCAIKITGVKHESVTGDLFSTINTFDFDYVDVNNVIRRGDGVGAVVGPVSSRGNYFNINHTNTAGTATQAAIFWDADDADMSSNNNIISRMGTTIITDGDPSVSRVDISTVSSPFIEMVQNSISRVKFYASTAASYIKYTVNSSYVFYVKNTSTSGSTSAKFESASGGGGDCLQLDRTTTYGRYLNFQKGGVNIGMTVLGTGTPEGTVSAPISSTYHRVDGGAGTSFYVKESGTGNTGWVGK